MLLLLLWVSGFPRSSCGWQRAYPRLARHWDPDPLVRFTPEQLGVVARTALAWLVIEILTLLSGLPRSSWGWQRAPPSPGSSLRSSPSSCQVYPGAAGGGSEDRPRMARHWDPHPPVRFTPEQLGVTASTALAWLVIEILTLLLLSGLPRSSWGWQRAPPSPGSSLRSSPSSCQVYPGAAGGDSEHRPRLARDWDPRPPPPVRFTPEQLGVTASTALVWLVIEILALLLATYFLRVSAQLRYLDLLAYCGYKYVG